MIDCTSSFIRYILAIIDRYRGDNPSSAYYFSNIGVGICNVFSVPMITKKQYLLMPVMLDNLLIISEANVVAKEVVIRFVSSYELASSILL